MDSDINIIMKKILLCVSGITPQIITETLYALAVLRDPPFIPNEIHVITTSIGRDFIFENLLDPDKGHFFRLIKDYKIPQPKFDIETIHVIGDDKEDVIDIVDDKTNELTANFILHKVKDLCSVEENWVHASIAGGRKTMSLFLGMGMQFYGKEIDEMSHVLVNPPFENHPDFYFPPNPPKKLTVRDFKSGRYYKISTEEAKITLAYIPFVRFNLDANSKIAKDIKLNFIVDIAQKRIQECVTNIEISETDLSVTISSKKIDLTPLERAIYFYFVMQKLRCERDICPVDCSDCYLLPTKFDLYEILDYYKKIIGSLSRRAENFELYLKKIDIRSWFLQHKSRINNKIKKVDFTCKAIIKDVGPYGSKAYGIDVPKEKIVIK